MELSDASNSAPEDDCPICKSTMTDPCRLSACTHVFCQECLTCALRYQSHCPLCRTEAHIRDIQPVGQMHPAASSPIERRVDRERFPFPGLRQLSPTTSRNVLSGILRSVGTSNSSHDQSPVPQPVLDYPLQDLFSFSSSDDDDDDEDDYDYDVSDSDSDLEQVIAESIEYQMRQSDQAPSPVMMTFTCPYCQEAGLTEVDLTNHCNDNHRSDDKHVVCPVCVSLPHGDPNQRSQNFIRHLNLRHKYYTQNYTNIHQSDRMNEQEAILESLRFTLPSDR